MLAKFRYLLNERHSFILSRKKTDQLLSSCRFFFITGMGRSGTTFLVNLLNNVQGTSVYHEVYPDFDALIDAYYDPDEAYNYFNYRRKKIIAARINKINCQIYGEVNSLLRYHVDVLSKFNNVRLFHLVRDGRSVVQSIMNRTAFTSDDEKITGKIKPKKNDPYYKVWPEMSRFEKVCWYWADTCSFLLQKSLPTVRFDDIIQSYEQFESQLLNPLQINFSYDLWQTERHKPKNVNQKYTFPGWEDWNNWHKDRFLKICGVVMSKLNYKI